MKQFKYFSLHKILSNCDIGDLSTAFEKSHRTALWNTKLVYVYIL